MPITRSTKIPLASCPVAPIPEETLRIAQSMFTKGNAYIQMRDELGSIYTDEMFANFYPQNEQLSNRPWRLALVRVMQYAECQTDRQAAESVGDRIAWKYTLSWHLPTQGLISFVLSEFRQPPLVHEAGKRLLDEMLQQFRN